MGPIAFWLIVAGHIANYKEFLIRGVKTFGGTFVIKRILKSCNANSHSDIISVAGYSLVGTIFVEYLHALTSNGSTSLEGKVDEEIIKGVFPTLWEKFTGLF